MDNTKHQHTSRLAMGAGILAALVILPLVRAIPAQAASIIDFDARPADTEPYSFYGATAPAARRIAIGPDTTTILLTHGFTPSNSAPVWCSSAQGVIAPSDWIGDGWDPAAPHPVAVIGPIVPGHTYNYHCHQDQVNEVDFTLVADSGAPATVTVAATPEKLVRRDVVLNHNLDGSDEKDVAPGDIVRVTGPAGTWGTPAESAVPTIKVNCGSFYSSAATGISFTPDGKTVQLTLPATVDQRCFNTGGQINEVQVSTLITTPGTASTPTITEKVLWSGGLNFTNLTQAATTTSLRLDHPVNLGVLPTKALITVRTGVLPTVTGHVDVYVDGHPAGGTAVPAAKSSTVQVVLPKLGKGYHTVAALFRENSAELGSRSPVVKVRILG